MPKTSAQSRFWQHATNNDDPYACWPFDIGHCREGYAQMRVDGVLTMAHRFAYEYLIGPIPDGLEVDHLCHNSDPDCPGGPCVHRLCVNPLHLEAVTPKQNTQRRKFNGGGKRRAA